jgi:hypothetical protein
MATHAGSALWLALAGGDHRVTAVISRKKVVGGQSSSQRSEKNCMSAKLLRVSLGVGIRRLHTAMPELEVLTQKLISHHGCIR